MIFSSTGNQIKTNFTELSKGMFNMSNIDSFDNILWCKVNQNKTT